MRTHDAMSARKVTLGGPHGLRRTKKSSLPHILGNNRWDRLSERYY